MFDDEISDRIIIRKKNSSEELQLDQKRVHIRESKNGLMGLSYVAPVFEAIEVERFFEDLLTSEKLTMDIGDTGEFPVSFRGLVDGKGKNFPKNLDHKIILLQGSISLDSIMDVQLMGFSKFKPNYTISE